MNKAASLITTLLILSTLTVVARADIEYSLLDLGTLGGASSRADGINSSGQICGGGGGTINQGTNPRTVFATTGARALDPLTDNMGDFGGFYAVARRINDLGEVIGEAADADGTYHAFRANVGEVLDINVHDMGTFGGENSMAQDINNAGQVVGYAQNSAGKYRAFRTSGSTIVASDDLGTLGGSNGRARGINSSGQVTGVSDLSGDEMSHAFLTKPNSPIDPGTDDLGTLGGTSSYGTDVNDAGQVVGNSKKVDGIQHAFRTAPNSPINPATDDLGTLGGDRSYARAINSAGLVVGWSDVPFITNWHAFLYRDSEMLDLNYLIDPSLGWELTYAADINDAGQIVGHGEINGFRHAFLLTPVPEPSTIILLLTGALGFLVYRKRRS